MAVAVRTSGLIPPPSATLAGMPGPFVWDAESAWRLPAVARCVQLLAGMTKQMPIDAHRGTQPLPRPRLVSRPDPLNARSWFVQVSVEDYLLNGNAISLVTSRGADGWPAAVAWLPAMWTYITWTSSGPAYYLGSMGPSQGGVGPSQGGVGQLPTEDVIHIKRGADRWFPIRGIGVVEQHLATLDRIALEEEYERQALNAGAVPSVAVITPNPILSQEEAELAKADWLTKFQGPGREPVILPNGTQVIPLAWSPTDTQLMEARKLSLQDVANMFNVDGYWLGAPASGFTYRTAGPMYQSLLRTSLEPILSDLEDVWSDAWLPRGTTIRFDRNQLLRDDLATTSTALVALVGAGIISPEEARLYMALPTAQALTALEQAGPAPAAEQLTGEGAAQ